MIESGSKIARFADFQCELSVPIFSLRRGRLEDEVFDLEGDASAKDAEDRRPLLRVDLAAD